MYSTKEVAEKLNVSPITVSRLLWSGELGSIKIGRSRRISEDHLEAFLDKCESKAKNQTAAKNA